jgi:polysaccharide export outer membrane protein
MSYNYASISVQARRRLAAENLLRATALITIWVCSALISSAQQLTQPSSGDAQLSANVSDSTKPSRANTEDIQYRIGAGDELSIQIFGKPQLSRDQHVDAHGMIKMPLLEGDIPAACKTEGQLSDEIARMYRDHDLLKNPAVYVSVKDYQSQPVAVLGAVNTPGRFVLQRRIRLLDLLVFYAGATNSKAGRKIQILNTNALFPCETVVTSAGAVAASWPVPDTKIVTYDLEELMAGKETANPYVRQGDIINVPAALEVYVIGNVAKPAAIPVAEPTTLGRALAMVGGVLANTKKEKVRVIRQIPGSLSTNEILIDLAAIDKSKGIDFLLMGGDIVQVDTKTGFSTVLNGLANTIVPTMGGLPLRVIR